LVLAGCFVSCDTDAATKTRPAHSAREPRAILLEHEENTPPHIGKKNMRAKKRKILMKKVFLLIVPLFGLSCFYNASDPGPLISDSYVDTMAVLIKPDTLNLFVYQSITLLDERLTVTYQRDSLLGDTIKFRFILSGETRDTSEKPEKYFEWRNDTLHIWFDYPHWNGPKTDSISHDRKVLYKSLYTPVPANVDIDTIKINLSNAKIVNWSQDTSEFRP
jgi:hypothetical protein